MKMKNGTRNLLEVARKLSLQSVFADKLSVSKMDIAVREVVRPLQKLTCYLGAQRYLPPGKGDILDSL